MRRKETGPAVVEAVVEGSPACKASIAAGDRIHRIDGYPMRDLIDFSILMESDTVHDLEIERSGATVYAIIDTAGEEHGILLESPVFGKLILCNNDCVFCFIDQLPEGLRPSFYIRDDDYRLSFLAGNFITLTNTRKSDVDRILEDRLSPLYISLHAYDRALREKIFNNPGAGRALQVLDSLTGGGIDVHVQIVLMKGLNDGPELDKTIENLLCPGEGVLSIGVVPVGATSVGKKKLSAEYIHDAASATRLIEQIESWRRRGSRTGIYAADEFFFLAGLGPPETHYYGDFPQAENGIGLARMFIDSFREHFDFSGRRPVPRETAIITSPIGSWVLTESGIDDELIRTEVCVNTFFGETVNVCGLMAGRDIRRCLKKLEGAGKVLIPGVSVSNGIFVDGVKLEEVSWAGGPAVVPVNTDGAALAEIITYEDGR